MQLKYEHHIANQLNAHVVVECQCMPCMHEADKHCAVLKIKKKSNDAQGCK